MRVLSKGKSQWGKHLSFRQEEKKFNFHFFIIQIVSGDYCECDNFSCDRYDGKLCSGPDHGVCNCGKCECFAEWDVPGYTACECRASNETCITPYGEHIHKLCSGHGECVCGECKCFETNEGQYSGRYCEDCPVSVLLKITSKSLRKIRCTPYTIWCSVEAVKAILKRR